MQKDELVAQDEFYANAFSLFRAKCSQSVAQPIWTLKYTQFILPDKSATTTPVRILSIGCGTAEVDCFMLLHALKSKSNPLIAVEYVGVDTNIQHIELATKQMQVLHPTVKSTFVVQNIHDYLDSCSDKFDVIMFLHCLYYVNNRSQLLHRCYHDFLHATTGCMFIMHQSPAGINVLQKMVHPWINQNLEHAQFNSGQVEGILQQMGCSKYTVDMINMYVDVSACYEDHKNFASEGHLLLSFLLECDTSKLPATLVKQIQQLLLHLCVISNDKRKLLFHPDAVILVSK